MYILWKTEEKMGEYSGSKQFLRFVLDLKTF